MADLAALWQAHRQAALPDVPSEIKGELWVLDEVMSGCIAYFLEMGSGLEPARIGILEDCRMDLRRMLPELDGQAAIYFNRLETLAALILQAQEP
jgi:hypothetical protein